MEEHIIQENCDACNRIACTKCDWVATDAEVEDIQKGLLTKCPHCGWQP